MKIHVIIPITLIFVVLASGCIQSDGGFPQPPISVGLEVEGTPSLGQEFNLTVSMRSPVGLTLGENDRVSLGIPEGFEVVSGDTDWTGTTLERGKTVEKKLTLKSVQTGQWTIYQSVCTNATDSGSAVRCALYGYENLYIDVMQDDAIVSRQPFDIESSSSQNNGLMKNI